jgi:Ca-activated chloride channel family protein
VRGVTAGLLACGATVAMMVPTAPATAEPADGRLLLLLDSSSSMKEPDASGATKIEAARTALNTVVDRLPGTAQVGLRVYGATPLPPSDPNACTDTDLVVPVGPADTAALKRAVGGYRPAGETPIAYSLGKAAADLGQSGPRTILLVSDGEESCGTDPCAVARQLHAAGIDLVVDVVGLNVNAAARNQLTCIADAGGGTYYDARGAEQLAAAMNQSSLRAVKDFAPTGSPVRGTPDVAGAPEIGPGRYTDTVGQAGNEAGRAKYYMVKRAPGGTVRAAVTARPAKRSGSAQTSDELKLTLLLPAGDRECTYANEAAFEWNASRAFLNTAVFLGPDANSAHSTSNAQECRDADRLVLRVERAARGSGGGDAEDPIELTIVDEPPVDSVDALPGPVDGDGATPAAMPPAQPQGGGRRRRIPRRRDGNARHVVRHPAAGGAIVLQGAGRLGAVGVGDRPVSQEPTHRAATRQLRRTGRDRPAGLRPRPRTDLAADRRRGEHRYDAMLLRGAGPGDNAARGPLPQPRADNEVRRAGLDGRRLLRRGPAEHQ